MEEVNYFMMVTEVTSEDVARGYLEISGGDPSTAIQTFFEHPEYQSSFTTAHAAPTASNPPDAPSHARSGRLTGRQDSRGVVHIDSDDNDDNNDDDDDDDISMVGGDDDDGPDIAAIARNIQEDEDAAMARRLQEELSGPASGAVDDGVRAPIAQRTETLAGPDRAWSPLDEDRDAAVMEQLRARQRRQGKYVDTWQLCLLYANLCASSESHQPFRPVALDMG